MYMFTMDCFVGTIAIFSAKLNFLARKSWARENRQIFEYTELVLKPDLTFSGMKRHEEYLTL